MNIDESIIEQRKQRRRERNRLAAQRCRLKKRQQSISVSQVIHTDNIGGSGGRACWAHASPYGTQFFHFRIHFHRKACLSEVHAPP